MSDQHNPPAFPLPGLTLDNGCSYPSNPGMSLRDWFAGQALVYAAGGDYGNDWGKSGIGHAPSAAAFAYAIADAMLAERERQS